MQFNLQKKPHIEVQNKSTIIRITPRNQRRSMINKFAATEGYIGRSEYGTTNSTRPTTMKM